MNNYVLEYLIDTAKSSALLIEKLYRQDRENPLSASAASNAAISTARFTLDNIGTSLVIDGRVHMAQTVAKKRDELLAFYEEIASSDDGGEGLADEVLGQIDQVFSWLIEYLEEAME